MQPINGNTRLMGIFGDPVAHSLSPKMQNAALAAAGIDAVYLPFHVHPDNLAAAVDSIRVFDFIGVNVTVPHKERILPLLDEVDKTAALIGAVNTVVNCQGRLCGTNTDAPGFLASLQNDLNFNQVNKQVVVLGAGGACRAALVALAGHGAAKISIANRSIKKAEDLASEMRNHFSETEISSTGLSGEGLVDCLLNADLLVNTTSVGLSGDAFPDYVVETLPEHAAVYDMVYTADLTRLIRSAQQRGLPAVDGRGMLVAQGESAFFEWFGTAPEAGVMRSQVIEK